MSRVTDRKVTDKENWERLWIDDKLSIIETMKRNLCSDILAGYDLLGMNIQRQIIEIKEYESEYEMQIEDFGYMTVEEVDRWCYYDLKRRGAIG